MVARLARQGLLDADPATTTPYSPEPSRRPRAVHHHLAPGDNVGAMVALVRPRAVQAIPIIRRYRRCTALRPDARATALLDVEQGQPRACGHP